MKKIAAIIAGILSYSVLTAAPTFYVVDMGKVYQNYYKAKEAASQIQASYETTKQELAKMDQTRQGLIKELQAIQEKVNNPGLAEAAKKKIVETDAQPKLVEVQQIETNMKNISEQASKRLQENARRVQQVHMEDIAAIVKKIAADKKADFIFEARACHFFDPKYDITDEVIKAVNATAPSSAPTISVPAAK